MIVTDSDSNDWIFSERHTGRERERLHCSGERGCCLTVKVRVFWGEREREMIVGDGGYMRWVVVVGTKEK
jgi:hypothetical protein